VTTVDGRRSTVDGAARSAGPLRLLAELTKVRISAVSTLSAATGYIVASRTVDLGLLWACLGTMLLACGASAFNEVQERHLDARMERTRNRPLPSGRIAPADALLVAAACALGGTGLLLVASGLAPALFGVAALLWYNGLYTPLKRVNAFAVVPGSVIGALPPAIGWTAGGGGGLDPPLVALAFFFFVWQVPHFWLLLFRLGPDYERAGFPTLARFFSLAQLSRLTFVWMAATAASCLLLPLFGLARNPWATLGLALAALALIASGIGILRSRGEGHSFRGAFVGINLFALAVMALLAADALLR